MMRLTFTIAIGLLMATVPAPASAQAPGQTPPGSDLSGKSLEALLDVPVDSVEGAARHTQRLTEAPASVTIVTATDIETFGWRTLADVLKSVRGFHVTYDRNYSYLGVRGFGRPTDYNNRVLLMLDGHRLNDNIYDAVGIGTEGVIDLDLVERIEVIRGPGSALYGTSAFFAVINIITRRGGAIGGVELSTEAGLTNKYRGRATAGWAWADKGDLLVSVSHLEHKGEAELYFPEFDTPETGAGRAFHMDGDEATSLLVNARAGRVNLQGAFVSRTKTVPTAAWDARFGDPRLQTTDTRGWLDATYDHAIGNTVMAGRAYVDRMGYEGTYPIDGDLLNIDSSSGLWIGGEMSAARRLGRRHRVTAGVEQRFNLRQAQDNRDEPSKVVYIHDSRTSQQTALFVQDEVTLSRRWTATLGARWDWWSVGPGSVRPRAGLVYRTDRDLAVKFLYGQAFRSANMYELFYTEPSSRPNPDLAPEHLTTSEIVFEQYIAGRVRLTAAGFVTRINDLIDQADMTDEVLHVNRGSAGATGLEVEAEYRSASGVLARGSFVAQRATDRSTGQSLSNAPERLGTLQLAVPMSTRDLTLGLDSTFVGQRLTRDGRALDAFWLSNLIATWQPRHTSLMLQGGVYNLFDQRYAHPVGSEFLQDAIVQDGRTASVKLTVGF